MTTAVYLRISQDTGLTRAGVKRQREDCEALCKRNKWAPIVVYEDNDTSAYSGRKRPAYQRMLQDVADGAVTRIVAWHPDRLHRSTRELEDFIDTINTTGCEVATVQAGQYDLTTASGRMTARVLGAVARSDSEHKSERIRRKMLELAQAGAWVGGGIRPYGYRKTLTVDGKTTLEIDPDEAAEIRTMMKRYLAGQSAHALAADLRARNIPTVNGGQWRTNTVIGILTGGVISAQRDHRGETVAKGAWPRIVTEADTRNARLIAATNQQPGARHTYLLTGVVQCAACGAGMHHGTHNRGAPILACPRQPNGCGAVTIRRLPLEQLIIEAVFVATDTATIPTINTQPAATSIVDECETQLDELAHAYAERIITMKEWVTARTKIQARLDDATHTLADHITTTTAITPYTKAGALRRRWPALPLAEQQAVLHALITYITVSPGVRGRNRFDPDRVTINWRN